jgi:hypothetical protein
MLKSASTWHAKMVVFVFMLVVVAWRKSSSYSGKHVGEAVSELTRGESRSRKSCTNLPELSIAQSSCRDLLRLMPLLSWDAICSVIYSLATSGPLSLVDQTSYG